MTERQFLINLAITHYRARYGISVDVNDVDIKSVPKHMYHDLAYEVYSIRTDDQFRIHMYLDIRDIDRIHHDYLGVSPDMLSGNLEDEQFVFLGYVDRAHSAEGYMWRWLDPSLEASNAILTESGDIIITESGEHLVLE